VKLFLGMSSLKVKAVKKNGCCPFHQDKTPSFFVNDSKGVFHCYGCDKGGDHFTFIMDLKGIDFPEALSELAAMAGLDLAKYRSIPRSVNQDKVTEKSKKLIQINKIAGLYFQRCLFSKRGEKAVEYLKNRGLSTESIKRFRIGYALDEFEGLEKELKRAGVPETLSIELGLIRHRKSAQGHYDTFRNRVIFPIWDQKGRPIAFGGRLLPSEKNPENTPKFLNSSESEIFKKSNTLYGLHLARKTLRDQREVILTEGYMDVIMLNQTGFENSVAALGTALSESHLLTLKKFLGERSADGSVLLMLDGDKAGIKAAKRVFPISIKTGVHCKIALLPQGKDAADLASAPQSSKEASIQNYITNSTDLIEVMIDDLISEKGNSLEDRVQCAQTALDWIAKSPGSQLSKSLRVNELAPRLNLPTQELQKRLSALISRPTPSRASERTFSRSSTLETRPQGGEKIVSKLPKAELELIRLIARYPACLESLKNDSRREFIIKHLSDQECKSLLQTALDCGVFKDLAFQEIKSEKLRNTLASALVNGTGTTDEEPGTVLEDALIKLEIEYLKSERQNLMAKIRRNPGNSHELEKREFEIITKNSRVERK